MKTGRSPQSIQSAQPVTTIDGLPVDEVIRRWPCAIKVFVRYRLACVGCVMAPFEKLGDVPSIYGLDSQGFLGEIQQAIHTHDQGQSQGQERTR